MDNISRKNQFSLFALLGLSLGALGVVFGDIGTSPLYAVNEIFFGHGHIPVELPNIYGAISLVIWALTLVITIKYVFFVLRADYQGQGGVFSLLSLLRKSKIKNTVMVAVLVLAAGLLFGDGIITPSISVLSAVEGLKLINPGFSQFVVPITLIILTLLFLIQQKGTGKIGKIFGPVMLVWFFIIAVLGVRQIFQHPWILLALNPFYGFSFIAHIGVFETMAVLGAVMLVVTGGEALYADLGHFGQKPIKFSWLLIVYPALILNYLGQGAFLLGHIGSGPTNTFFGMVAPVYLYPMVILATIATVIASQALISGIFSLISQAIDNDLVPKLRIRHTNPHHEGQIYIGVINWILYACCVEMVLIFKSSAGLAASYGLAVSGVELSTSVAMILIAIEIWKWKPWKAYALFGMFAFIDFMFLFSNSLKFLEGGYVPVFLGIGTFIIMNIWLWGRTLVWSAYNKYTDDRNIEWLGRLKKNLAASDGYLKSGYHKRVLVESDRVAVFVVSEPITSPRNRIPVSLRMYMKRTGSLPKFVIFLHVNQRKIPEVAADERFTINKLGKNMFYVAAHVGFMEKFHVRQLLNELNPSKIIVPDLNKAVIIIDREQFFVDKNASWLFKVRAAIFKVTLMLGVRTHTYLGLSAEDGLFEVEIPIHFDNNGSGVTHPEFDLYYSKRGDTVT